LRHTYWQSRIATSIRGDFVTEHQFHRMSRAMGNLPLPASTGAGVLSVGVAPPASDPTQAPSTQASRDVALLGVLREAALTGRLSADAILNALADAARVLSSADGTAIASRSDGVIVCRARSGAMAPDLGAPLNADSGISGECLRTALIQICNDASTDRRVDSEACRALGIRSVAVVPLRGRMGIFGILEAFSARANAFEEEQINSLRSLAEIAEMAYERQRSAAKPAATLATVRAALFPVAHRDRDQSSGRTAGKRYWVFGGALLALLAMAWIARISWWQTDAEIAASTSTRRPASPATDPSKLQLVATVKPDAAVPAHSAARARAGVIENAADIDRASDTPTLLTPSDPSPRDGPARKGSPAGENTSDSPPPVQTAFSGLGGKIPFTPETAPLPRFGGPVSRGIIPATVLERVNPVYPWHARSHGIGGEVILDATVAPNGSVRIVTVISGPPTLTDAAVTAVRQWRFSPALLNGKPVEVQQRITIRFKLPEGSR
jgi:TonB family protein